MNELPATQVPARPFLDWPVVTDPSAWSAAVACIGLPHSEPYPGEPFPNDQSRAPEAVRQYSPQFCDGSDHWDFDLGASLAATLPARCLDCGNVPWDGGTYDEHMIRVSALMRRLWSHGAQVLVLGGDHGVTIPVLDALETLREPVHILHIDAHLDWRQDVRGVCRGYSSPLYWASTKPWVSGMTQVGLRGTGSARREEFEAAREYGSSIFTAAQIHEHGTSAVIDSIPADCAVYVTIDADGLDPTEMPAVMAPAPGGLLFRQVAALLRAVARTHRIVGMDIVEIAPAHDSSTGITCITAGRLVLNVLGASWGPGGALRRGSRSTAHPA